MRSPSVAHRAIRDDLAKALQATLTPVQLEHYQAEAGRREAACKQATIASVVSQIDGALLFSEEQRELIAAALDKHWQDDWERWLQMWRYSDRYYPTIPEQHLTPHLSEEQKAVWRGLQKVNVNSWSSQAARDASGDAWWDGKAGN
jgi:hypothetical protein